MARSAGKCESGFGMVWFAGWMFSLGYLHLGFWKGLIGIILWPYFLGSGLSGG